MADLPFAIAAAVSPALLAECRQPGRPRQPVGARQCWSRPLSSPTRPWQPGRPRRPDPRRPGPPRQPYSQSWFCKACWLTPRSRPSSGSMSWGRPRSVRQQCHQSTAAPARTTSRRSRHGERPWTTASCVGSRGGTTRSSVSGVCRCRGAASDSQWLRLII